MLLYHGTISVHENSIRKGIRPELGKEGTDFGRGFYLTTVEIQATDLALDLVDANQRESQRHISPIVIVFECTPL